MEALRRGIIVSKPHEGARYDFIVDCGRRLFRVQVKSTATLIQGMYRVNAYGSHSRYSRREVDFIAAYVVPLRQWYIIPLRALRGAGVACISPCGRGRLSRYLDAWHLLLDKPKGARIDIQAVADVAIRELEEIFDLGSG